MAGIWDIDFEGAAYNIGIEVNEHHARIFFRDQIEQITEKKWWVIDFVKFQYGEKPLNMKSPIHKKVHEILTKYSLHNRLHNRVKYKEEEKEEVEDKEKENTLEILNSKIWIEEISIKQKIPLHTVIEMVNDFLSKESLKPGSLNREIKEIKTHIVNWITQQNGKQRKQTDRDSRQASTNELDSRAGEILQNPDNFLPIGGDQVA